jgi:adenine-specific DNA-methyltransferase
VTSYDLDTTDAVKNRPYWYRPKRQESARVLVKYASRDGFTFILNEADVRHINSLYGFYDVTVDETELKALLAYLNSDVATEACREQQRARQGGFEQLEPNKLEAVLVIDPTALPEDIVTTLAAAFDTLRETVRRGDDPDPVIDRIDTILQQEL